MDYQGNSKKTKPEQKPEKKIERVTTGEVIVQKQSLGSKVKSMFVEADFKSVVLFVIGDVLIPAAKNMFVDAAAKGASRMVYGDTPNRYRGIGQHSVYSYNRPINRDPRDPISRSAPQLTQGPRLPRNVRDDFILSSREEADRAISQMNDLIDTYGVASVADLNESVGWPKNYIDNQWGWENLANAQVRQVREGYLLDLPPAQPINQ